MAYGVIQQVTRGNLLLQQPNSAVLFPPYPLLRDSATSPQLSPPAASSKHCAHPSWALSGGGGAAPSTES